MDSKKKYEEMVEDGKIISKFNKDIFKDLYVRKLDKYKENLLLIGDEVYSYYTNVASIEGGKLIQHGWWSVTTQKHINYVAKELNLKIIENY
tara:strand:+ start:479 stop:754 length:276 start_codon:yes stop_codon:yes gene_type:complete